MKLATKLMSAALISGAMMTGAFAAGSNFHAGANPAAYHDIAIVNNSPDTYAVYAKSYNTLQPYNPYPYYMNGYDSSYINFNPGDTAACLTIVRLRDNYVEFKACVNGGTIPLPYYAAKAKDLRLVVKK